MPRAQLQGFQGVEFSGVRLWLENLLRLPAQGYFRAGGLGRFQNRICK